MSAGGSRHLRAAGVGGGDGCRSSETRAMSASLGMRGRISTRYLQRGHEQMRPIRANGARSLAWQPGQRRERCWLIPKSIARRGPSRQAPTTYPLVKLYNTVVFEVAEVPENPLAALRPASGAAAPATVRKRTSSVRERGHGDFGSALSSSWASLSSTSTPTWKSPARGSRWSGAVDPRCPSLPRRPEGPRHAGGIPAVGRHRPGQRPLPDAPAPGGWSAGDKQRPGPGRQALHLVLGCREIRVLSEAGASELESRLQAV